MTGRGVYQRLGVQTLSGDDGYDAVSHVTDGAVRRGDRTFQGQSLGCLSTQNPIRATCILAVTHPRFDTAVLVLILVNTVFLVLDDPLADPDSPMVRVAEATDVVFLMLFTLECAVKIIAMGFTLDRYAYLRDWWNAVDFIIVLSGHANLWLPAGSGDNITSLLRLVRVFRPLRSINRVPGMRGLVNTLFSCLPIMVDVVLLAMLIFYLFSLVGVVLWNDSLHHRCWLTEQAIAEGGGTRGPDPSDLSAFFYSDTGDGRWGRVCGNNSAIDYFHVNCPQGTECVGGAPPPYTYANFDHLGKAILLVFQCVTLDGWISHAYSIEDGWSPLAAVFFIFLTLFGAYFFANLILAVVTDALTKHVGEEADKAAKPQLTTNALVQHDCTGGAEDGPSAASPGVSSPRMVDGAFLSASRAASVRVPDDPGLWPDDELAEAHGSAVKDDEQLGRARHGSRKTRGTHVFAQIEWASFVDRLSKQAIKGLDNYRSVRRHSSDERSAGPRRKRAHTGLHRHQRQPPPPSMPPEVRMFEANRRRASAPDDARPRAQSVLTLAALPRRVSHLAGDDPHPLSPSRSRSHSPQLKGNALAAKPSLAAVDWKEARSQVQALYQSAAAKKAAVASALAVVGASCVSGQRRLSVHAGSRRASPIAVAARGDSGMQAPLLDAEEAHRRRRVRSASVISEGARSVATTVAETVRSRAESEMKRVKEEWQRFRERRRDTGGIRGMLEFLLTSSIFLNFISACILGNALMLSIEHYNMPRDLASVMTDANLVFTIVFMAETILKVFAFGPVRWVKDGFNVFDGFIAAVSIFEVIALRQSSRFSLLRVLRLFRVLRVLKLARRWRILQRVISVIALALEYIGYLLLLIALFIFVFSVLGRALLAGKLVRPVWCHQRWTADECMNASIASGGDRCEWRPPENGNCTASDSVHCCRVRARWSSLDNTNRANFDDLLWAALHTFQILTKDNWSLLCFRVMREVGGTYVSFFVVILVLGTYLLFSMFIAILLVKLGDDGEQKEQLQRRLGIGEDGAETKDDESAPPSPQQGAVTSPTEDASPITPIDAAGSASPTSANPGSPEMRRAVRESSNMSSVRTCSNTYMSASIAQSRGDPTEGSPAGSPAARKKQALTRTEAKLEMMKMRAERKEELKDHKRMNYRTRRESIASRRASRSGSPLPLTSNACSPVGSVGRMPSWQDTDTASITSGTVKKGALVSAMKGGGKAKKEKSSKRAMVGEVAVVEAAEESPRDERAVEMDELLKQAKVLDQDEKLLNFAEDDERSDDAEWEPLEGRSCFMFGPNNALRIWLTDLLLGRYFEYLISYAIIINCMLITLNENLLGSRRAAEIVRFIDWGFTGIFTIEIAIRCVVHGAFVESKVKGKGDRQTTYLRRHRWNIVDAAIVVLSLIAIPFELMFLGTDDAPTHFNTATRMIKACRAFRPLRILVRTKRMKVVIGAFVSTIPAVFNVLAVAFVLYFVFGIAGTQLMSGSYRRCSDGSDRNITECMAVKWNATRADGVWFPEDEELGWRLVENKWHNPMAYGFDHLLQSWVTLLEVASLSGWMDIMYEATDAPDEVDGSPKRGNDPWITLFFVLWIFCGAYCVMNIFTGVVVDHFTRKKLELSGYGSIFLTDQQEQSLRVKRILSNAKAKKRRVLPKRPTLLNQVCHRLVCNPIFPKFILACIVCNMALMATIHHNMDSTMKEVQTTGNFIFTIIFTLEMFLEIGIAGVKAYLRFRWCRLDCAIVIVSWFEFALTMALGSEQSASVIQLLRLGRAIRVLKHFKGLRDLLMTLYYSLPAFYNISSLLLLMCFMYGVLGTALFEDVRITDTEELFPVMLSKVANFQNFPRSVLTLYRVATMDSWVRIVKGCQVEEPYCSEQAENCGNPVAAFIFFTTFQLSVGFVMMNLFIAVVLENFRESVLLPEELMRKMDQITLFRDIWSKYDPQGRQFIPATNFVPLMKELPQPIGLAGKSQRVILPSLKQLDFPVTYPDQRVLFVDAIDAVGEVVFDIKLVDSLATRKYLRMVGDLDIYRFGWSIAHFYAACVIQTAFRNFCTGQPVTGSHLYVSPSTDANLRAAHKALRTERRMFLQQLKQGHPGESTLGVPAKAVESFAVKKKSGVMMARRASLAVHHVRRPSDSADVTSAVLSTLLVKDKKPTPESGDDEDKPLQEYNLDAQMQLARSLSGRRSPRSPGLDLASGAGGSRRRAKVAGVYEHSPADKVLQRDSSDRRLLSLGSRSGSLRALRKQVLDSRPPLAPIKLGPPPEPPPDKGSSETAHMMDGIEVVSECGSDLSLGRQLRSVDERAPAGLPSPPRASANPLAGPKRFLASSFHTLGPPEPLDDPCAPAIAGACAVVVTTRVWLALVQRLLENPVIDVLELHGFGSLSEIPVFQSVHASTASPVSGPSASMSARHVPSPVGLPSLGPSQVSPVLRPTPVPLRPKRTAVPAPAASGLLLGSRTVAAPPSAGLLSGGSRPAVLPLASVMPSSRATNGSGRPELGPSRPAAANGLPPANGTPATNGSPASLPGSPGSALAAGGSPAVQLKGSSLVSALSPLSERAPGSTPLFHSAAASPALLRTAASPALPHHPPLGPSSLHPASPPLQQPHQSRGRKRLQPRTGARDARQLMSIAQSHLRRGDVATFDALSPPAQHISPPTRRNRAQPPPL